MTGLNISGADNGVRTRDPHLGKVVLYQLSHVRIAKQYSRQSIDQVQEEVSIVNIGTHGRNLAIS